MPPAAPRRIGAKHLMQLQCKMPVSTGAQPFAPLHVTCCCKAGQVSQH